MGDLTSKWTLLISLIVLAFSVGCKKKKEEQILPAYTQEGRNTIGAFLNDEFVFGGKIRGNGRVDTAEDGAIDVQFYGCLNDGSNNYSLDFTLIPNEDAYYLSRGFLNEDSLWEGASNFVDITYYDTLRRILSGTFEMNFWTEELEFITPDSLPPDPILPDYNKLRKGRFDLRY